MKLPESHMGSVGWAAIAAGVLVFDVLSRETLSSAYTRYLERNKLLAVGTLAVTAAHLLNVLPEPIDPFYQVEKRAVRFAELYL